MRYFYFLGVNTLTENGSAEHEGLFRNALCNGTSGSDDGKADAASEKPGAAE